MSLLTKPYILLLISRNISKSLGVELTDKENLYISKKAKELDIRDFPDLTLKDIVNVFTRVMINNIKLGNKSNTKSTNSSVGSSVGKDGFSNKYNKSNNYNNNFNNYNNTNGLNDTLEIVDVKSIFGISDTYKVQMLLNPEALYEHNYIELDSKNAVSTTVNTNNINIFQAYANATTYRWEYMESALQAFGVVNTVAKIKNVIGIRMYPLKFAVTRGYVDFYNTYNILIEEFQAQAFIGHQGRKFLFTVTPTVVQLDAYSRYVEYSPYEHNKGYCWFKTPYTTLKSFTLTLAQGNDIISLPTSNVSGAVVNYATGSIPTSYANPGVIWCFSPHNSKTGDILVISGFTTNDPVTDAVVIAEVNNPNGYAITVIDSLHFSIPVDLTVVSNADRINEAVVTIVNLNIRTVIPLEIISLKNLDENDN